MMTVIVERDPLFLFWFLPTKNVQMDSHGLAN